MLEAFQTARLTILGVNAPIVDMSQQQLAGEKAELDAAWAEAMKGADAALERLKEARSSNSNEDKESYLRTTQAALFAHNRWTNTNLL